MYSGTMISDLTSAARRVQDKPRRCEGCYGSGPDTEQCWNEALPGSDLCAECQKLAEEQ